MRITIKGGMRGESCEDVVYAIVYGMRVIIDPIAVLTVSYKRDPEWDRIPRGIVLLYKGRG